MLSGCASQKLDFYKDSEPKVNLEEFFTGPIKGWGIVQDRKGRVIQRFDVTMDGTWKDGVGTLDEVFNYYDGREEKRIWTITKTGENTYSGTAGDILGEALGKSEGSTLQWAYQMDLKVKGRTWRITFDDWMYNMNDGVLINRSYLKKFGITMAELTLFMQKQPE